MVSPSSYMFNTGTSICHQMFIHVVSTMSTMETATPTTMGEQQRRRRRHTHVGICFRMIAVLFAMTMMSTLPLVSVGAFSSFHASKSRRLGTNRFATPLLPADPLVVYSNSLSTSEARISYITSRIDDMVDLTSLLSPMNHASSAVCCVDNFLGAQRLDQLRSEARSMLPKMLPSPIYYGTDNTQRLFGQVDPTTEEYFGPTPHLTDYVETMTRCLTQKVNRMLPANGHFQLNGESCNKLAVCLGDGSRYDKHIDNPPPPVGHADTRSDRRKLTVLLYLQSSQSHVGNFPHEQSAKDPRGGYFRAYDTPTLGQTTEIAPKGDRLLVFWSDALLHDVTPSYVLNGEDDQRWALTIWCNDDHAPEVQSKV
jgi:2OG-Fe(II) oxygenase superfamily